MRRELCLDNGITVVESEYKSATDTHGNAFITLTSGGVKKEGMPHEVLYTDFHRAWAEFEGTLLAWLGGRRQIHLRQAPVLVTQTLYEDPASDFPGTYFYTIVCRLTAY